MKLWAGVARAGSFYFIYKHNCCFLPNINNIVFLQPSTPAAGNVDKKIASNVFIVASPCLVNFIHITKTWMNKC